jgi:hypothetical protein
MINPNSIERSSIFERKVFLLIVFSVCILIYGILLALFSHKGFPQTMNDFHFMPYLSDKPVGEDAFYYLTVAWNVAAGKGIVYNFGQPTTGFQPLIILIYSALAFVVQFFKGDQWIFIRTVIVFNTLIFIGLAHIIGRISQKVCNLKNLEREIYSFAYIFTILNFNLYRISTFGLETAVYLTCVAICILTTFNNFENGVSKKTILIGVSYGLAALARIDFNLVFGVFLFSLWIQKFLRFKVAFVIYAVGIIIQMPWFLWVHGVSNVWMPSSGTAQMGYPTSDDFVQRIKLILAAISNHITPGFYLENYNWYFRLIFPLFVFTLFFYDRKSINSKPIKNNELTRSWLLGLSALIFVYPVFFFSSNFYLRYTAPLLLVVIPTMACCFLNKYRSRNVLDQSFVILLLSLFFILSALLGMHSGVPENTHSITAQFAINKVPKDVRVGAMQSGAFGFFYPVVNLDGKMNYKIIQDLKKGNIAQFVRDENIDVMVDWLWLLKTKLTEEDLKQWAYCTDQPANWSVCLKRRGKKIAI